jgi:hypothetical protein
MDAMTKAIAGDVTAKCVIDMMRWQADRLRAEAAIARNTPETWQPQLTGVMESAALSLDMWAGMLEGVRL